MTRSSTPASGDPEETGQRVGELLVFWWWAGVLTVGLVLMVGISLMELAA